MAELLGDFISGGAERKNTKQDKENKIYGVFIRSILTQKVILSIT